MIFTCRTVPRAAHAPTALGQHTITSLLEYAETNTEWFNQRARMIAGNAPGALLILSHWKPGANLPPACVRAHRRLRTYAYPPSYPQPGALLAWMVRSRLTAAEASYHARSENGIWRLTLRLTRVE